MPGRTVAILTVLAAAAGAGCRRRAPEVAPAPTPAPAPPPPAPAPPVDALPPDYDPTALTQGGADPLKVYLAEPRDAAWAGAVEDVIGHQLDRDLKQVVPDAGGVSMGCRTLSCLILVDAPADKQPLAMALVGLITLGPVTVDLGPSPEGRGQLLFLTERRMADPATFTAWFRKTRQRTYQAIRDGSAKNPLPIPAGDLPAD